MTEPNHKSASLKITIAQLKQDGKELMADALASIVTITGFGSDVCFIDIDHCPPSFLRQTGQDQRQDLYEIRRNNENESIGGLSCRCSLYLEDRLISAIDGLPDYQRLPSLAFFDGVTDDQFRLGDTLVGKISASKLNQEYLAESVTELTLMEFQSKKLADNYLAKHFKQRVNLKINEALTVFDNVIEANDAYCSNREWIPQRLTVNHDSESPAISNNELALIKLNALFNRYNDEFLEFNRIANPRHSRPDLCAFILLHEIAPAQEKECDMISGTGNDQIFLNVDLGRLADNASEADIIDLIRCGVRLDLNRSLCMFT